MGFATLIKRINDDQIRLILWSSDYFKEITLTDKEFNNLKESVNKFENVVG